MFSVVGNIVDKASVTSMRKKSALQMGDAGKRVTACGYVIKVKPAPSVATCYKMIELIDGLLKPHLADSNVLPTREHAQNRENDHSTVYTRHTITERHNNSIADEDHFKPHNINAERTGRHYFGTYCNWRA